MKTCECCDPGCQCGGRCQEPGETTLYRIDMEDVTGTVFCADCAEDANDSGVFTDSPAEDDEDDAPCEEDYILSPTGPLGGLTGVSIIGGSFIGRYSSDEDALTAIRARMDAEKFWPNVWYCSDHGNMSLLTMPA